MSDQECVRLLQWCLPRLGLPDMEAYRRCLESTLQEWAFLDRACCIPVSRFYRDRAVFENLECHLLPALSPAVTEAAAAAPRRRARGPWRE